MFTHSQQIKRDVAKHSLFDAGEIIVRRNEALLTPLLKIGSKPNADVIYELLGETGRLEINIGCPQCSEGYQCDSCLWTFPSVLHGEIPQSNYMWSCCQVAFGGVCYEDVKFVDDRLVAVEYSHDSATLHVVMPADETEEEYYRQEYKQVVAFLRAHIAWGKWKCWGNNYKG